MKLLSFFLLHHADESKVCRKQEGFANLGVADIDSRHKDPLMCSLYAPDIYNNLHAIEVRKMTVILLICDHTQHHATLVVQIKSMFCYLQSVTIISWF